MKKILLAIGIVFLAFQMVVMAAVINIGTAATNRGSSQVTGGYTYVHLDNPADGTGEITSIEIWANDTLTGCKIATFYLVSGTTYTARDVVTLPTVTSGAKRTFTEDASSDPISLSVVEGDFIGIYADAGKLERDYSTGGGSLNKVGDHTGATVEYAVKDVDDIMSLCGIGETGEEEEEANAIFFGTNF